MCQAIFSRIQINRTYTVMIPSFRTDRPGQTVQTQIRLLLGLHCLPFRLHHLDSLLYGSSNFRVITTNVLGVRKLRIITVITRKMTFKQHPLAFMNASDFIRAPKILWQYDTGQNLSCRQQTLSVTYFYFCRQKQMRRSDLGLCASSLKMSRLHFLTMSLLIIS